MYAWSHSEPSVAAMRKYLKEQLELEYAGIGLYLQEDDTLLMTVQDSKGERAAGRSPSDNDADTDFRLVLYVFNCEFKHTVFNLTPRTASDSRP